MIDLEIDKGFDNKYVDDRIISVNTNKYIDESYQLFRLEFSEFLKENEIIKNKIIKMNDKKQNKNELIIYLYSFLNKNLGDIYSNLQKENNDIQQGGDSKFIEIIDEHPNIINYKVNNNRDICAINSGKQMCNKNIHCSWNNNQCKFSLTNEMLINFINKISEELLNDGIKKDELLQLNNYFVSDIVSYQNFTERPKQTIIKNNNNSIKKIMELIFGKNNIPKIGRRYGEILEIDYDQLNLQNSLKELDEYYIQNIINNNNSLYRAFANVLYWNKNNIKDVDYRNLGYYSQSQTDFANYFKSIVIDWLIDKQNKKEIIENLSTYFKQKKNNKLIHDFVIKISNEINTLTNCVIELYVLSKKYDNIIFAYNENNQIIYIFENGLVFDININKKYDKKYDDKLIKKNSLHIRFNYITHNIHPDIIEVLYMK